MPTSFKEKRGNAYMHAFWILIRKLCIKDFRETMEVLKMACAVCDLDELDTSLILDETLKKYLEKEGN